MISNETTALKRLKDKNGRNCNHMAFNNEQNPYQNQQAIKSPDMTKQEIIQERNPSLI